MNNSETPKAVVIAKDLRIRYTEKGLQELSDQLGPECDIDFERKNNYFEVIKVYGNSFSARRIMPEKYDHRIGDYLEECDADTFENGWMEVVPDNYEHKFDPNIMIKKEPFMDPTIQIESSSITRKIAKLVIEEIEEHQAETQTQLSDPELGWFIGRTLNYIGRALQGTYVITDIRNLVNVHNSHYKSKTK